MAWYNRFIGTKPQTTTEVVEGYQSFSTPFGRVGDANLSLPYVNGRYQIAGYIPFGQDNMFPELLNQLYYTSPLHGAIVDFKTNSVVGGGYTLKSEGMTNEDKLKLYTFEKKIKLGKVERAIAQQLTVHHRVYFKLCYNAKRELYKIYNVSPEKVRIARDKQTYFLCDDWSARIDVTSIKKYHPTNSDLEQLYVYEIMTLGQEWYPLPQYTSALNFAFLSGELSYFAKSNIQNSVFPSFAMMFPKRPQSEEEKSMIKHTIDRLKGAANAGKAVAFFANSADQLPKIESLPTNGNDKLFHEASALNTEQICFAHTIDPILMGVRTTGSLGGGADIKQAYVIFEKNVVMPLRVQVEEIVNELLEIAKIPGEYTINNFQIINETIVEIDDNISKISDIINSVNPALATKIIESMTPNELRSLIDLPALETTPTI
jgi:hypothetical protein